MKEKVRILLIIILVNVLLISTSAMAKTEIRVYYPVQVAGALTKVIEGYVKEFNQSHPEINALAVYAGNYDQTMQKAQTAFMAGKPPDVAILRTPYVLNLIHMGSILPLDDFIGKSGGQEYLNDFYPSFIDSVRKQGKIWGIPYQISTPLFYFNREMLKEAGLDPNKPPETWDELIDYAQKLTKRDSQEKVIRYGFGFPNPDQQWMLQAWTLANGGNLASDDGTKVFFNTKPVIESVKTWIKLVHELKVSSTYRGYGQLSSDFVAGQVAMMYNSTGSLSFVRKSAKFDFGVAFLPKKVRHAVPLGGGHLFVFKKTSPERQKASWEFIRFMSSPEISARWSIDSGYIATRKSALDVPEMKEYVSKFPHALVALKQLKYAYPWWAVYEWSKVTQEIRTLLSEAVDGKMSTEEAMALLQKRAEEILKPYLKK